MGVSLAAADRPLSLTVAARVSAARLFDRGFSQLAVALFGHYVANRFRV